MRRRNVWRSSNQCSIISESRVPVSANRAFVRLSWMIAQVLSLMPTEFISSTVVPNNCAIARASATLAIRSPFFNPRQHCGRACSSRFCLIHAANQPGSTRELHAFAGLYRRMTRSGRPMKYLVHYLNFYRKNQRGYIQNVIVLKSQYVFRVLSTPH